MLFWRAYVHSPSRSLLSPMYVKGPIEKKSSLNLLFIATVLISQGVGCRHGGGSVMTHQRNHRPARATNYLTSRRHFAFAGHRNRIQNCCCDVLSKRMCLHSLFGRRRSVVVIILASINVVTGNRHWARLLPGTWMSDRCE